MPIPGFNADLCRRANRTHALRGGAETISVVLYRTQDLSRLQDEALGRHGRGSLPKSDEHALELINALALKPQERDNLFIHYGEAISGRFVPDRYMFVHESTGMNCARRFAEGVAFMNSHRTGGGSQPTELPFGRTFAGRWEPFEDERGQPNWRTLFGMYMLARNEDGEPIRPNGANGPSTADFHAMIQGGVLHDTSAGLYGGSETCDVCERPLGYGYFELDGDDGECPHAPGTRYGMDKEAIARQMARGVTEGRASYSLRDAWPGEESGVYDGAVPSSGFRKALSLAARMDATSRAEALKTYHLLARGKEFAPHAGQLLENRGAPGTILSPASATSDLSDLSDEPGPEADLCPACGERMEAGDGDAEAACGNAACEAKKPKRVDDPDEPDDGDDNSVSAAASAEVAAACPTLSTDIPAFDPSEPIPPGIPFAVHARQVVSACDRFAARLVSRRETRESQGRPPDKAMLAAAGDAIAGIQAAIGSINAEVALATPTPTPVSPDAAAQQQLRLRALTTRADVLRLSVE